MDIAEIKARTRVVCICRGISLGKIKDAIAAGCDTHAKLTAKLGCGTGGCQGTRCGPVIEDILKKHAGSSEKT